jgi:abhydrolase domain-containing protein 6
MLATDAYLENEASFYNLYQKLPNLITEGFETAFFRTFLYAGETFTGLKTKSAHVAGFESLYLEGGNPNGETLVWLHGFSDSRHSFALPSFWLRKKYRLIVPDVPGFEDRTYREHVTYDMDFYGAWFREFCVKVGLKNFYLAGNSLGGGIALQHAVHYPEDVKAVAAVNSAGVVGDSITDVYEEVQQGKNLFFVSDWRDFNRFLRRIYYRLSAVPFPIKAFQYRRFRRYSERFNKVMKDLTHGFLGAGEAQTKEAITEYALDHKIKKLAVPTLVLWGREDSLFPENFARTTHGHIPNAELELIEECGHCPHLERPKEFARHLLRFFNARG